MEWSPHMETIQVVIDSQLLAAADRAARRSKLNRSALFREALRGHLARLRVRELEERDRRRYEARPQTTGELAAWESEASWPRE